MRVTVQSSLRVGPPQWVAGVEVGVVDLHDLASDLFDELAVEDRPAAALAAVAMTPSR